jgi:hypothetical protein
MDEAVRIRKIKQVWHFTRLVNIDSILEHGLLSRQQLETTGIDSEYNDENRFDYQNGAICCSIGFPNYRMFYRLRQSHFGVDWVVIALNPKILWEKDCAFCITNAANSSVTCIPIEDRKGPKAFNALYEEIEGKPSRSELDILDSFPTDPQAEVLVLDPIEVDYIIGVATESSLIATELAAKHKGYLFKHMRELFAPRSDWEHWR